MTTDARARLLAYYDAMKAPPAAAVAWARAGRFFAWRSTLPENQAFAPLDIFWRVAGDASRPAIVLVHGYPTSSFDFAALMDELAQRFYVCALDLPGHGFSDKPRGYRYSLFDDAQLVDHFIREVLRLDELALYTHDKGDSVGLVLLQLHQARDAAAPYRIRHHFITNGNVYLPLAQLTWTQKLLLHPLTGPIFSSLLPAIEMARGLGRMTYSPRLGADDVAALASVLDYQGGMRIQHALIQYLAERKAHEREWLDVLARSPIATTLVWGEGDTISPVAVADFVWSTVLAGHADARSWRIPRANHYLQSDHPALLAAIVRAALDPEAPPPGAGCQPQRRE